MTTLKERPTTQTRTAAREKEFTPLQTAPPKKKFPVLGVIAGVAVLGLIAFAVLFFTQRGNEPKVSAKDEAQTQKVLSGQWTAKDSADLEKDVNQQIAEFQKNQGQITTTVPNVPVPETKTDKLVLAAEYNKKIVDFQQLPGDKPGLIRWYVQNKTDRTLPIRYTFIYLSPKGDIIEKTIGSWGSLEPGEKGGIHQDGGGPGIAKLVIQVETK